MPREILLFRAISNKVSPLLTVYITPLLQGPGAGKGIGAGIGNGAGKGIGMGIGPCTGGNGIQISCPGKIRLGI